MTDKCIVNVASFKAFQHFTILHARRKWHKGAYVNSLDTGIMLRCAGTSPSTSEVSPLVNDSHRPSRVRLWCCCASPKRRNIISPHAISATSWVTPYITQRKHLELCSRVANVTLILLRYFTCSTLVSHTSRAATQSFFASYFPACPIYIHPGDRLSGDVLSAFTSSVLFYSLDFTGSSPLQTRQQTSTTCPQHHRLAVVNTLVK